MVGSIFAIVTLAATFVHFTSSSIKDLTGFLAIFDHIFDLTFAVALSLFLLTVGYATCRRLGLSFASTAETLSFSFYLGTGLVGLLVILLGLAGLLRPTPVLLLSIFTMVATAKSARILFNVIHNAAYKVMLTQETRVIALAFLALVAVFLLRTATPPAVGDELIYHLPATAQFVQHGRVHPLYDNSLGNMPFLIHMIYALCLMARSDIAARVFSLFLAVAAAFALYGFSVRFLSRRVAALSLFGFFAAGMIVEVAITTRIDVALAGMLFMATYAMINFLSTARREWLWVAATLSGLSLGIKHTAAIWLVVVAVMYVVEMFRNRRPMVKILKLGITSSLLLLVVACPWYIKNAIWFQNPVYPFITGEVAEFGPTGVRYFNADDERKLDSHFQYVRNEVPDVVVQQDDELTQIVKSRLVRHPMRLWEFFTNPNAYLMAEPYHLPNYLFLLIPVIILLRPTRWIVWLLILSLTFVFSVTATSWIARYLVPAYPALTIVAVYTVTKLCDLLRQKWSFARLLPTYVVLAALATSLTPCVLSMTQYQFVQFLAGRTSREDFLMQLPHYRPLSFINQLPQNARVMIVGAQLNYGLERSYYSDESWFATKWRRLLARHDSFQGVNESLKAQHFTHILYNPGLFRFAAKMGLGGTGGMSLIAKPEDESQRPEYPLLRNWSTFTVYKQRYLEVIYRDENGYEVLKIK